MPRQRRGERFDVGVDVYNLGLADSERGGGCGSGQIKGARLLALPSDTFFIIVAH